MNPTCLLQLGGSVSAFVQPGTTLKVFALLLRTYMFPYPRSSVLRVPRVSIPPAEGEKRQRQVGDERIG